MTVRARKLVLTGAILSIAALFSVGRENENEAQENQQTEGLIITADRTESKLLEDGSFYKRYAGNVHARTQSRDADVSADVAEYDSRTGEVRFYGKSEFRDSTRFLSADTVVYRELDAELDASGHVRINEVGRVISADRVRYLRSQKTIALTGSVAIRDDSLAATITGEQAVFNDLTGQALISGNPAMILAAPGQGPLTGRAAGIDETGALLLRRSDGSVARLLAGDVHVVDVAERPAGGSPPPAAMRSTAYPFPIAPRSSVTPGGLGRLIPNDSSFIVWRCCYWRASRELWLFAGWVHLAL